MKVEDFLGKSVDEIQKYIISTDFSGKEIKSLLPELEIPISNAILNDGQFEIYGILSDGSIIRFFEAKAAKIDLVFTEEKLFEVIDVMRNEFSDTLRFHNIEDFEKAEWVPMEKAEDAFLEIKTKQLHFDNTKIFNPEDLQNYQTISCNYRGFNFLINPSKSFVIEDQKFYQTEIW